MKPHFASLGPISINLFVILLSLTVFPNNTGFLVADIKYKAASVSKENIYIHFDKTHYNQGENIWYKVYLVGTKNHAPRTASKVTYVDLIDPNNTIIDSKTIKMNEGAGKGDFKLPEDAMDGAYTIRAYTNFMRNFDGSHFFRKNIYVNVTGPNNGFNTHMATATPFIAFSPEGGNMIGGFLNRIVVKATNSLKKGVHVKGDVFDDTNTKTLHFETTKFGLGSFQFIPQKGRSYTAIVSHNGVKHGYPLPPVKDHGATIRIDETHNSYRANVYSSLPNGMDGLELSGFQKGEIICQARLNGNNAVAAVDLPKSDVEYGLIRFQLVDKNGTVLSEELAFIDSENLEQKAIVTPSKKTYEAHELAEIEISFDQLLDESLKADMSVSVTEVNPETNKGSGPDIKSQLLFNPEIRDDFERFGSYFANDSVSKKTVHQILIAQKSNQLFSKDNIGGNDLKFLPESGFSLKGTVKEVHKNKPVKAHVTVTYKNGNEIGHDKTITDSLGRFSFNDLNFDQRTFVAVKAKRLNARNYSRDFIVELDSFIPPPVHIKPIPEKTTTKGNALLEPKIKQHRNTEFAPRKGEIKLNEIKLIAEKKRLDRYAEKRKAALYVSPSRTLDFKNLRISPTATNPLHALQGRIPGFDVIGNFIIIRGRRINMVDTVDPFKIGTPGEEKEEYNDPRPLFLVDGFPTDYDFVTSMSIQDIDFVDIIQPSQAAIYGVRGGVGVIAFYTFDGSEENDIPNNRNVSISFYHPGYYQARKFNQDENDSSTLYWNPDLKLEPSHSFKIAFKTGHKSATYKILLEGITSKGTPFKAEAYFDVK
ncbi:MG2 domain-containing protein [Hwangdonia sp.]|uniref:MG2 domain-containing protein n=1 Tax=Hwangdonia sp. TaxID=1883432 RepID=UPI003AB3DB5C